MTAAPVLSVVIPVFNEVQTIGRVLAAVSATLPPAEKQIVDWRDGRKALGHLIRLRFYRSVLAGVFEQMKSERGYLPFPVVLHHVLVACIGARFGLQQLLTIENAIFTEWRLRFYCRGVAVALVIAVLFSWVRRLGHWVVEPDGRLGNIDFCWMWVSGKFAAMRHPMQIYDRVIYAAAQHIFYRSGECQFMHQYVYPPTYLFFTYPLGLMPYKTAYAVWVGMTFLVYAAAIYVVVPRSAALIAALASAAVLKNIELGHNGFPAYHRPSASNGLISS